MAFPYAMLKRLLLFATAVLATGAAPTSGVLDDAGLEQLRSVDRRLGAIAFRLATSNRPLCRDVQPVPGWVIHAEDQYDAASMAAVRRRFGFAVPVAVEAVVAGSPAADGGIRDNDGLLAINGRPLPPAQARTSSATRDAVLNLISTQDATAPMTAEVLRDGERRRVTIVASPGCRSQFEVLLTPKMTASADGRVVQIGVRFLERYPDDQVAAVVAHEMAHNILQHRARLQAAGVKGGLLAEFGRSRRLVRQAEEDADLLSVALLRNAGYDPLAASRFWREHGGDVDGGVFRSRTHPSSTYRVAAIEAAAAAIPADAGPVYTPPGLGMAAANALPPLR